MDFFGCKEEVHRRGWRGGFSCLPGYLRAGFVGGSRVREGGKYGWKESSPREVESSG